MLCTLAKADILGRKCSDRRELLDKVDLCHELALEEGCLDGCYPFQCALTRHSFLQSREVWKDQQLHDDTWGEVVMLSGLPGTGKDAWIESNLPGTPMISLDDIRNEMGVKPDSEQGMVANIARDRAKELLRAHRPFVWNATNITAQTRSALISIFETYKARTRIVYLETPWKTLLAQNSAREAAVPESVIRNMLSKLTLPELHEAHKVEWIAAK